MSPPTTDQECDLPNERTAPAVPLFETRPTRSGSPLLRTAVRALPVVVLPFAVLAVAACQEAHPAPRAGCAAEPPAPTGGAHAPAPEPVGTDALGKIGLRRASFREDLAAAQGDGPRHVVVREAAHYLEGVLINVVLPRWNGTPWSFSGTSTTPGTGTIACGYFVSTTLEEAGLRVERRRLAQQAAEDIILTLAPPGAVSRFSDVPVEKFGAAVAAKGDGLYVVGLDNHVGFLIVRSGEVLFHHSSYVGSTAVVREKAVESPPLVQSRYRVVGKLFTEDTLVEAWIRGTPVPTRVRGGG